MNNKEVSKLSIQEWEKVRKNFYISNVGMNKEKALKALFLFDEIMKILKIDYFLSCGTALGFYRDNDFIDWDDEIDVDVFLENFLHKISDVEDIFIKNGFIVRTALRGITTKMSVFYEGIKIAIGVIHDNNQGYRCYKDHKIPSRFYENGENFSFNGKHFKLPSPIEEYLEFWYGDWKKPIKSYEPLVYLNKEGGWKK